MGMKRGFMRGFSRRPVQTRGADGEARALLRTVLLFRLAVVSMIFGAGVLLYTGSGDRSLLLPRALLVAVTIGFTAASWVARRAERPSRLLVAAQLLVDLALATAIVGLGGGYTSPFTFVYVLCILSGAALRSSWGALAMGSAASAAYGLLAVVELRGSGFPREHLPWAADEQTSALTHVLLQILFFQATAVIAALLAEKTRRRGAELRATDRALREARINTDTIIQSMRSGLLTVDAEGKVNHFNRAAEEILGCLREDVAGRHHTETLEPRCPELSRGLESALSRGETPSRLEAVVLVEGKEPGTIGVSLSLLRTTEGGPRGVVAIFQDLTEVKRMEERMRRADRLAAVGELAGAIAHEIRNPLSTISGSVEILAAELEVDGDHRRLLELTLREANHLKRLTTDFLTYGRLKPKEVVPVDVKELLKETLYLLRHHEAFHPGIELAGEEPTEEVWALWDGEQIRQVLVNVGVNALEAMPRGGALTVRMSVVPWEVPRSCRDSLGRLPRAVRISFEDTGGGLSPEGLRRVFEPFYSTKPKGTGLGLAIVARIVEDHGGLLDLRSHPGEGTCFTLTLPGASGGQIDESLPPQEAEEPLPLEAQSA